MRILPDVLRCAVACKVCTDSCTVFRKNGIYRSVCKDDMCLKSRMDYYCFYSLQIQLCYENICGDRSEAYCDKGESTGSRPLLLTALQANSTPPRLAIIARSFANATAPGATYSHVLLPLPLVSAAVKSYCFVGRRMFFTDGRALYTSALEWREQLALRHSFPIYSPYSSSGRTAGGASSIERVACDPEHSSSRVFLLERSAGSLRVAAVSVDPLTVNAARLRATGADNEPIEIARQQLDPTRTLAVGSLLYSPRHRCAFMLCSYRYS